MKRSGIVKKTYGLFFLLVAISYLIGSSQLMADEKKRIVFLTPTSKNNTYWPQVHRILKAISQKLPLDIDIYEFDVQDRFQKQIRGVEILNSDPKPDGAVLSVAFGNALPLLETAEKRGIPVFIQGPLFPTELPDLGRRPRNRFKMWVGYFYQDETKKGYLLGKTLLRAAHDGAMYASDGSIQVAGIGGDFSWFGSELRKKGLIQAVAEDPDATMLQVVPTKWTEEEGMAMAMGLINRYNEVAVIWAASDQLGIGAANALVKAGRTLGVSAVTGGLDLSVNGLNHVKNGQLYATVSGALIDYAAVTILLYDYAHGIDFSEDVGTEISTPIHVAEKANADRFLWFYRSVETIDFSKLSKIHNPGLTHYDFSISRLMDISRQP